MKKMMQAEPRRSHTRVASGAAFAALLLVAALVLPAAASAAAATSAACTKATNIEAIIDDSGSMETTDPGRLRVQAMNLLIDSLNPATRLGAVEFGGSLFGQEEEEFFEEEFGEGPSADTLFPPEPVGPNAPGMRSVMNAKIQANNGLTDYNAAFAQADADNPTADARLFLTDGGHNVDEYMNGHLNHPVPTYVIGFGSVVSASEDRQRLKQIATSTGGQFFALDDSSDLQAVANAVAAALTCLTPPRSFHDELSQGHSKTHALRIGAAIKSVRLVLSWTSPKDRFKLAGIKLVRGKRVIAAARPKHRKPRKLKIKTKAVSKTFAIFEVSRLSRGKLRFKVRAARVRSSKGGVPVTTQANTLRRRR